jgi:hypothetical protein|tara:strand:+ start:4373 stop:4585 length:213 start_codon:yes stop_codon:yes gene_type:complete
MFYIIKVKGAKPIPDFVQIRDLDYTLRAYFRLSQIEKGIEKNNLKKHLKELTQIINKIPFGKIHKFTPSK